MHKNKWNPHWNIKEAVVAKNGVERQSTYDSLQQLNVPDKMIML